MDDDTKLRREIHAAIAMHALLQIAARGVERTGADINLPVVAKRAFEVADAMIEAGGPLE